LAGKFLDSAYSSDAFLLQKLIYEGTRAKKLRLCLKAAATAKPRAISDAELDSGTVAVVIVTFPILVTFPFTSCMTNWTGKTPEGTTDPSVTLNSATIEEVVPVGMEKSVLPSNWVTVRLESKPKKLNDKSVALRVTPEVFVILPVKTSV
jgi:hypothetical protein